MRTFRMMAINRTPNAGRAADVFVTCPVRAITVEIVPGPLNSGIASGISATSCAFRLSKSSSGVWRARAGFASIMSKAILRRSSPATIRNASIVTPNKRKIKFPNRANDTRTASTTSTARVIISARSSCVFCGVMERKIGMFPMASNVTKMDTNAVTKKERSESINGRSR